MNLKNSEIGKKAAAEAAALLIKEGMLIGLGTGSTANYFIEALGALVKKGLKISAVATSKESYFLGLKTGIKMIDINLIDRLDLTVDGADEITLKKEIIKGGGGALLREKIIAKMSSEMIVIVDESKLVEKIGNFPLPVEIVPFAYLATLREVEKSKASYSMRKNEDGSFYITDNGNYIVDLKFKEKIKDPEKRQLILKEIPGVIETGLFINMAGRVIVGYADSQVKIF